MKKPDLILAFLFGFNNRKIIFIIKIQPLYFGINNITGYHVSPTSICTLSLGR